MPDTTERLIQFFRVKDLATQSGDNTFHGTWGAIDRALSLPLRNADEVRYLNIAGGDALSVFPLPNAQHSDQPAVRFCRLRRTAIPMIERQGDFEGLDLGNTGRLAEAIQVVIFKDGVVGADYNNDGPRLPALRHYLLNKPADEGPALSFEPLVRGNIDDLLDALTDLRMMRLEVRPAYSSRLRQTDAAIADAVDAQGNVLGDSPVAIVEAKLRTRSQQETALSRLKNGILAMIHEPDFSEQVSTFKLKGKSDHTGRVEEIDILADRIVTRRSFVKQDSNHKALDPDDAARVIRDAYNDIEDEIKDSPSLRITE